MNVLGVQEMKLSKKINKRCKKDIKVVYISSPMKVKTCASKFRALVQELTGKNSDADAAALRFSHVNDDAHQNSPTKVVDDHQHHQDQDTCAVSSTSSGGVAAAMDQQFDDENDNDLDLFMPHREGSFLGMFTSNLFHHDFNFQQDYALPGLDSCKF